MSNKLTRKAAEAIIAALPVHAEVKNLDQLSGTIIHCVKLEENIWLDINLYTIWDDEEMAAGLSHPDCCDVNIAVDGFDDDVESGYTVLGVCCLHELEKPLFVDFASSHYAFDESTGTDVQVWAPATYKGFKAFMEYYYSPGSIEADNFKEGFNEYINQE